MKHLIMAYIEDKKLAWSPTTLKSEAARLASHAGLLLSSPEEAWAALASLKPYTRVTTWTRMCQFVDWAIGAGHLAGPNQFSIFRSRNARLFKHSYNPALPAITFDGAKKSLENIADAAIQRRALLLLYSGLRYHELDLVTNGAVRGKGGRVRQVYVPDIPGPEYNGTYHAFWRALASVGLKPHTLRKLALTRLVELGANEFELREIAGWASIQTASSYIKANDGRKKQLMEKLRNAA